MKWIIVTTLAITVLFCNSQKYDYVWLAGYESWGYDSTASYNFGISKFDFNQQPVTITYDSLGINFSGANAAISDRNGQLLFYTNGVTIRNSSDEIIENGDSLGNGYFLRNVHMDYYLGNPLDMLLQVLPNPLDSNTFDLFYVWEDTVYSVDPIGKKLLQAQVQMNANQGHGIVNFKDRTISTGSVGSCLGAVKHANGKDWWLCTIQENTGCYNLVLYDGNGVQHSYVEQCGGFAFRLMETAFLRFSPDGNWLMSGDNEQGRIDFFRFDRCSGILTLKEDIYLPEVADSNQTYLMAGGEYSPNGRYAYVCAWNRLYQFDMQAPSISASKTLVGVSNKNISLGPLTFFHAQLAPDGKIYISSENTINYIAVINSPDSAGSGCDFQDTGFQIPSIIQGLPYYPNYRLGPEIGSACDTIDLNVSNEGLLKLFPNPATNDITVDYGFTNWSKGQSALEICNILGQRVYDQTLPIYSGFQTLNISRLSSGVYIVYIKQNKKILGISRFVKD